MDRELEDNIWSVSSFNVHILSDITNSADFCMFNIATAFLLWFSMFTEVLIVIGPISLGTGETLPI